MVLKHLKLPKNHFKTNLFFSNFCGGDLPQLRSPSGGRLKLISSLEERSVICQKTRIIQNRIRFMACTLFFIFLFFPLRYFLDPSRRKKTNLKHWILHSYHFKTHLFFFHFGVGALFSFLVQRVAQT